MRNRQFVAVKPFFRYLQKRWQVWLTLLLLAGLLFYFRYDVAEWVRTRLGIELPEDPRPAGVNDLQWCETNYSEEMREIAADFDLPYDYLMALAVLECGGNKPAGNRFEKHIYNQLKKVQEGKRKKFENIRMEDLAGLDDEGLRNLATSWGPFQLMGYKVIGLGVNVVDIRDEETAAYYGAKWIKNEYGHFLKKKKWKDAFHYHNTGKRFPLSGRSQTHNPYYVSDGLKYMKYFGRTTAAAQ